MSGDGLRQSKHEKSRETLTTEEILEKAKHAFARKGYLGTNLGDVASALGVTRQAIYYYFPTKHDILVAMFDQFFDHLDQAVADAIDSENEPAERFKAMLRAHIRTVGSSPQHSSIFMRDDINLSADQRKRIGQRRRHYNNLFVDSYRESVDAGDFTDEQANIAVALLLGAANWTFRWFRPHAESTPDQLADLATSFLASGFVKMSSSPEIAE